MSRLFILCVLLVAGVFSLYAEDTPSSVKTFYGELKNLEKATSLNEANLAQQHMSFCFMGGESGDSGIDLSMDGMEDMTSTFYTMKLFDMIYNQKSLKTEVSINNTELIEQPDQTASMQRKGAQHRVTYVTKKYLRGGNSTTYKDVVITYIENGLIVEMENSESFGESDKPSFTKKPVTEQNVEQLRAKAAWYYSKGRYAEAYDCYGKLVESNPTDGDASYRIALLTFWRKGCKDRFSKKVARNKALTYIDNAIRYGNWEIRSKAENVKANWNNRNVYF